MLLLLGLLPILAGYGRQKGRPTLAAPSRCVATVAELGCRLRVCYLTPHLLTDNVASTAKASTPATTFQLRLDRQ